MTPLPKLFASWFKPVVLLSIFAMVVTAIITPRLPRGVDVSTSLTVPVPERPESGDYEYDGYYALQATDLFSNTLSGWFKSPDFVSKVFQRAELPRPAQSLRSLGKVFTVKKISGQLVEVQFHAETVEEGKKIAYAVSSVLEEQVEAFNKEGKGPLSFAVLVGEPIYIEVVRNTLVRSLVAALVVFVLAYNLVILIDGIKSVPRSQI